MLSPFEFGIATTAIQYAVGASLPSKRLREYLPQLVRKGIECPACCGTWLGLALHTLGPFSSWLMSAAVGMVLTAIGRSLMSLGYEGPSGDARIVEKEKPNVP